MVTWNLFLSPHPVQDRIVSCLGPALWNGLLWEVVGLLPSFSRLIEILLQWLAASNFAGMVGCPTTSFGFRDEPFDPSRTAARNTTFPDNLWHLIKDKGFSVQLCLMLGVVLISVSWLRQPALSFSCDNVVAWLTFPPKVVPINLLTYACFRNARWVEAGVRTGAHPVAWHSKHEPGLSSFQLTNSASLNTVPSSPLKFNDYSTCITYTF